MAVCFWVTGSKAPPEPLVMSVGRELTVPWQSTHSTDVTARGSP